MSAIVPPTIPPVVLVVDDNGDDLLLAARAASKLIPPIKLVAINNGADAVAYVSGNGQFSNRTAYPLPSLMILDLKMPLVSGFDVLSQLFELNTGKPPFICVMSSSVFEVDINKAKALGADDFHTKPADFADLCKLLQKITLKFAYTPPLAFGTCLLTDLSLFLLVDSRGLSLTAMYPLWCIKGKACVRPCV